MEGGPPIFPRDYSCPAVLWIQPAEFGFKLRDSHTLRSAFPCGSVNLEIRSAVLTPHVSLPAVWPLPRSLATTCGISVDFFSSPYLDVSVQAVPHNLLFYSQEVDRVLLCRVSPFGNPRIADCFRLPVAYRRSLRPSSASNAKAFPLRPY